ncbi:hypothetical protein ACJQWK_10781 [Exserohilum turcicum]
MYPSPPLCMDTSLLHSIKSSATAVYDQPHIAQPTPRYLCFQLDFSVFRPRPQRATMKITAIITAALTASLTLASPAAVRILELSSHFLTPPYSPSSRHG